MLELRLLLNTESDWLGGGGSLTVQSVHRWLVIGAFAGVEPLVIHAPRRVLLLTLHQSARVGKRRGLQLKPPRR
jgi:hypothetical protein